MLIHLKLTKYKITVNLEKQIIYDDLGFESSFDFDYFRKESILKGLDDIGITLEFEDEINNFESKLKKWINSKFT